MRKQFDIKFKPQIESGEYKVFAHEHEEQEARIVCWDNKGEYPIVALVDNEPEKFDIHGRVPGGNRGGEFSLFIVTPEEELTPFEKRLWEIMKSEGSPIGPTEKFTDDDKRVFHAYSGQLLELARKQFQPEIDAEIAKAYKNADKIVYENGVLYGMNDTLNDLPRWKKCSEEVHSACVYNCAKREDSLLYYNGHTLRLIDLERLPGFND